MLYISRVDYNRETVDISDSISRIVIYANITFKELKFILEGREVYGVEIVSDKILLLDTFDVCDVLDYEDVTEILSRDTKNMVLSTDTEYTTMLVKSDNIKDISSVIYNTHSGVRCYVTNKGYSNNREEAKVFSYKEAYTQAKYMTKVSRKKGNNILWKVEER